MVQPNEHIQTYGVTEQEVSDDQVSLIIEEIRIQGYSVVTGLVSESELVLLRKQLDDVYQQQIDEVGDEQLLQKINDADIARCPLAYKDEFLDLATLPLVLSVARKILGDNITLMLQNGIINRPDQKNYQVSWHRDLNYQHYVSSRPLSISALVCIDPFTEERGATWVLDGSQHVEKFPSEAYVLANQKVLEAPAGSVIIFDSMMYHRSGINQSDYVRRGVNHMYVPPFIRQQIDIPAMLAGRFQDHEAAYLLGYNTQTELSVKDWRMKRINTLVD